MSLFAKHFAVTIIGASLTTVAQASAQVPNEGYSGPAPAVRTVAGDGPLGQPTHDVGVQAPADVDRVQAIPDVDVCDGPCPIDPALQPERPVPVVVYAPSSFQVADPETMQFSIDTTTVRAGGWILAIVGLGALVTGIAVPMVDEPSHTGHGAHRPASARWALPLAIGGGAGVVGGLVVVGSCGPIKADETEVHGPAGRAFGLGYRGSF